MATNIDSVRAAIRERIWRILEERRIARPPFPVQGRIPNFVGAEQAADRLASTKEWMRASVVKINPDSPQRPLRYRALLEGKTLVMPTPRLRSGFLILDPRVIPRSMYRTASTIRGAFRLGKHLRSLEDLERGLPGIDMIVEGAVAVDRECNRLGKGEGYGDIEYALLYLVGKVDDSTPVATTVHDLQIVDTIPPKPHDLPLDIVATPTRLIKCPRRYRPRGIVLESLTREKLTEIPILRDAYEKYYGGAGG